MNDIENSMRKACKEGDTEAVQGILEKGFHITDSCDGFHEAFTNACWKNHMKIMKLLIDAGVDITSFHSEWNDMCSRQNIEKMRLFIESGYRYDLNFYDYDNIHYIFYEEECGDIVFRDFEYLCMRGFLDMIKVLVNTGFDVSSEICRDGFRKTCWEGHRDVAEFLLKNGVDIDSRNRHGDPALHYACRNNFQNVAECLIEYGADLNIQTNEGETALDRIRFKCSDGRHLVVLLIEHGVNYKQGLMAQWKIDAVQQRVMEIEAHSEIISKKCYPRIAKLVIEFSFGIENLRQFLLNNTISSII